MLVMLFHLFVGLILIAISLALSTAILFGVTFVAKTYKRFLMSDPDEWG